MKPLPPRDLKWGKWLTCPRCGRRVFRHRSARFCLNLNNECNPVPTPEPLGVHARRQVLAMLMGLA